MEDTDTPSPAVQRLRLRTELRHARQEAGLTQGEVAKAMEWSLSKLIRIENGSVGTSTNDLKAILQFYKITDDARVAELLATARAGRGRSKWTGRADIPKPLVEVIEYENAAQVTRNYQPLVVPGMLQTADYARVSTEQLAPELSEDRVESIVQLRLERQQLLERSRPPQMFFAVDEAVVRRIVGGTDVMHDQLQRLIAAGNMPDVTVEVVPYSAGLWPGMQEPFVIHQFSDAPDDYVLYIENPRGDLILAEDENARYQKAFERLREYSLGPHESIAFLHDLVGKLS